MRYVNDELLIDNYDNTEQLIEINRVGSRFISLFNDDNGFSVKDEDSNIYSVYLSSHDKNNTIIWDLERVDHETVEYRPSMRYELYSDGRFDLCGTIIENVLKYCEIALNRNHQLLFLDDNGERKAAFDGIDNFYQSWSRIYIIKNDQLICTKIDIDEFEPEQEVVLVEGASQVRFPTDSYYDMLQNNPIKMKSARKY